MFTQICKTEQSNIKVGNICLKTNSRVKHPDPLCFFCFYLPNFSTYPQTSLVQGGFLSTLICITKRKLFSLEKHRSSFIFLKHVILWEKPDL